MYQRCLVLPMKTHFPDRRGRWPVWILRVRLRLDQPNQTWGRGSGQPGAETTNQPGQWRSRLLQPGTVEGFIKACFFGRKCTSSCGSITIGNFRRILKIIFYFYTYSKMFQVNYQGNVCIYWIFELIIFSKPDRSRTTKILAQLFRH